MKSITKYGDSYIASINGRYKSIIEEMQQVDPSNQNSLQKPALSLVKLMKEAGVDISIQQAKTMLFEISSNKTKAYNNLTNISRSIKEFQKLLND